MNTYNLTEIELQLKQRLQWGEEFYKPYGYINPEKFGLQKALEIISGAKKEDDINEKTKESLHRFMGAKKEDIQPIQPINGQFIQPVLRWVKATVKPLPSMDDKEKLNVKYKGEPELLQTAGGKWYWFDDTDPFKYPVQEDYLSAIEWLEEVEQPDHIVDVNKMMQPVIENYGVSDNEYLTREILKGLGFEEMPHYTVQGAMIKDIGRDRVLSIGCVGTPNEMLFIEEVDMKEVKNLVVLHNFDYDGRLTVGKLKAVISLLNIAPNDAVSDTTEDHSSNSADPQNTTKEPVIDNLRDKFFKVQKFDESYTNYELNELFDWFKPYLKSNSEPVIDWEGLHHRFWLYYEDNKNGEATSEEIVNWLKSNLANYIK